MARANLNLAVFLLGSFAGLFVLYFLWRADMIASRLNLARLAAWLVLRSFVAAALEVRVIYHRFKRTRAARASQQLQLPPPPPQMDMV